MTQIIEPREGRMESESDPMKSEQFVSDRGYFATGLGLLSLTAAIDFTGMFGANGSVFYVLTSVYAGMFGRGRGEILLHAFVLLSLFFVPVLTEPNFYWQGDGFVQRATVVAVDLATIALIWYRRKVVPSPDGTRSGAGRSAWARESAAAISGNTAEQRRVEESLKMMRFGVDHAGDSVFWVSREGNILYANEAACAGLGYSRDELYSMTVFDLDVDPRYQPSMWISYFEELKRCRTMTLETLHRTKNGYVFPVEVNANYVHIGDNEFNFAFVRDITERKKAEERLSAAEHRLAAIFRSCPVGMCITTIDDGTFLELNDVACDLARCSREELLGRNAVQAGYWINPDDRKKLIEEIEKHGSLKSDEFAFRRKDGTIGYALRSIERMTFEEQDCILSMFIDITERKQIEAELALSRRRLKSLSQQLIATQESERRHLARELHDEIGQVLTAIKMSLRRTERVADSSVQNQLRENVEMVDRAIVQVRNLSLSLRPPQLDELGLVAAVHWLVKHQAQLAGFEEQLDVDLGGVAIWPELETVCFRIAQEALTNAVRHGKASKVQVTLRVKDNELYLSVIDNGIGFDVGDGRERALSGSSIGLIGMEERANLVGGRIKIESTPGEGTTVHVWLPLSEPD